MKLTFTKMHGCGNDYIYMDCFIQTVENPEQLAISLSERHNGIGSDGLILICPSDVADARMRMFNLDGSEGKMCGNGVRCVAEYLFLHEMVQGDCARIETLVGIKTIWQRAPGLLTVDMGAPVFEPAMIPVEGFLQPVINQKVEIGGRQEQITCVSMGNPHCVVYVDDVARFDVMKRGRVFEHHRIFPEGVNTEFVQVIDSNHLKMRVWERGSGETLACGTGACASVAASIENGICFYDEEIEVELPGGVLSICRTKETVLMTGDAVVAFTGTVEVAG